jgi:hypothetical protein
MKTRNTLKQTAWAVLLALAAATAAADDGVLLRKSLSGTPDYETEFALINMLRFYVPAQASDGTTGITLSYSRSDGTLVETRTLAKPLIATFTDGHVDAVDSVPGFIGHGQRDAFGALSFDDGATWKKTNLSLSGTKAIKISTGGKPLKYYGDVVRMASASAGNKVLAAWVSRYCDQGSPAYLRAPESGTASTTAIDPLTGAGYQDLFGVRGSQGYVVYEDDWAAVGAVPYSCVWTARGTVEKNPTTGQTQLVWRKAERLTAGVRDAHRIEVSCAHKAGCAVTWQEDPEGLRPGDGEGPGEGWSGAVAHKGTDVWYSWIDWANFDFVAGPVDANTGYPTPVPLDLTALAGAPQVGVPMAVPVRLTDNEMCKPDGKSKPYCYAELDSIATYDGTTDNDSTLCAGGFVTYVNRQGQTVNACITEDGRVMNGQTAATRARTSLQSYTRDDGTVSAWVVVQYEENKALGELDLDDDGYIDGTAVPAEIGKNNRYMSFEMRAPELVRQGLQLNQPAVDWLTGEFTNLYELVGCRDSGGKLLTCGDLYETEIARRGSLITQPVGKVVKSGSKTAAVALFKQGLLNQGGPADIMIRRFVAPEGFDPAVDNPFDEKNMVCTNWQYTDGLNPNYLDGLCMDAAVNVSATIPVTCEGGADCGYQVTDPDFVVDDENVVVPKVLTWDQTVENLDDQSWENPYDVAKGHRGFLDKDFLMLLYAWSPNWKANTTGKDQYNLYVRRSFDGGVTWTTTPAGWAGDMDGAGNNPPVEADGTVTCEIFRLDGGGLDLDSLNSGASCTTYAAGVFEKARNVSQLGSLGTTVLDPRFSPSASYDVDGDGVLDVIHDPDGDGDLSDGRSVLPYMDDYRDPSRYLIVYETGDNATVALGGEATPLDLFYSRGFNYGDEYVEAHAATTTPVTTDGIVPFDALEANKDLLSGEASVDLSPSGDYTQAVWNQWQELLDGTVYNSDAWYRRVYLDDDGITVLSGSGGTDTGGGGGGGGGKGGGRK